MTTFAQPDTGNTTGSNTMTIGDGGRIISIDEFAIQLPDGSLWRGSPVDGTARDADDEDDPITYNERQDAEAQLGSLLDLAASLGVTGYRAWVVRRTWRTEQEWKA